MQNINFSKNIYQNNVLKGCVHIIKRMQSKISEDQTYEINTEKQVVPEIPAVLLKMGFDLEIFIIDDTRVLNSIYVYCRKDGKRGRIKSFSAPYNSGIEEKYRNEIKRYLDSRESDILISKIEKCLG